MKLSRTLACLLFIMTVPFSVHAGQEGGGGRGGGNWTEGDLKHFLNKLRVYLSSEEGQSLFPEIKTYNQEHADESFDKILSELNPRLVDGPVYDNDGNERDCVSGFDSVRFFKCDQNALPPKPNADNISENSEYYGSLYRLDLHEAFVQVGLEKPLTKEVPSEYRLSSRLDVHLENFPEWVPGVATRQHTTGTMELPDRPRQGGGQISPDRRIYAYSHKAGVTVIDLITSKITLNIDVSARAIDFSPDGKLLCVAKMGYWSHPDLFTCFDASNGQKKYDFPNRYFLLFLPDSQSFVTMDEHLNIMVHDVETGHVLHQFAVPTKIARRELANEKSVLSYDGHLLAISTLDNKHHPWAHIFELTTGKLKFSVQGLYPSFDMERKRIATVMDDRNRKGTAIYDATSGRSIHFIGEDETVIAPTISNFLPDGQLMQRHIEGTDCEADTYDDKYRAKSLIRCLRLDLNPNQFDRRYRFYLGTLNFGNDVVASDLNSGHVFATFAMPESFVEAYVLSEDRALFITRDDSSYSPGADYHFTLRVVEIPPMN